ncbi:MAG: uroporphyrinogen decarboxylase [Micavibrio sp.]|nr:MAG: uroporphyrinogen decarboxylase [Micavibrio sp.]
MTGQAAGKTEQSSQKPAHKPFLAALSGKTQERPPFWFMRQAGRYLPEYRKIRAEAGGFLDLCFSPDLAAEVTLQPLRRFDMDAAILFSDILIVPYALGQSVAFEEGRGPVLGPLEIGALESKNLHEAAKPVYRTIRAIRKQLAAEKALIGFAGAPWTVATYMVEGGSSREFKTIREMAYKKPQRLDRLIALLTEATTEYLLRQIDAGAEAIQIFDSWAGILPQPLFEKYVIAPTAEIVSVLQRRYPDVPVIGFPKGAGLLYQNYIAETGVTAVSLDHTLPSEWAARHLQKLCPVQGCLDPMALLAGGDVMLDEAKRLLDIFSGGAFVFNLGHGIHKETPPENVAVLSAFLKGE